MKKVLNLVLLLAVAFLTYSTYRSIMSPIEFNTEFEKRDAIVKKRLLDIREAQKVYSMFHEGKFAPTIDSLESFVKQGKVPHVTRTYEFNDKQYQRLKIFEMGRTGLSNEEVNFNYDKADNLFIEIKEGMLNESAKGYRGEKKYTSQYNDIVNLSTAGEKPTIEEFARDTTYIPALAKIKENRPGIDADSMFYVPYTKGKKFYIETNGNNSLYQASADFEDYLQGINDRELKIFILDKKKEKTANRKKFIYEEDGVTRKRTKDEVTGEEIDMFDPIPCRKIGDIEKSNNGAGNWE